MNAEIFLAHEKNQALFLLNDTLAHNKCPD